MSEEKERGGDRPIDFLRAIRTWLALGVIVGCAFLAKWDAEQTQKSHENDAVILEGMVLISSQVSQHQRWAEEVAIQRVLNEMRWLGARVDSTVYNDIRMARLASRADMESLAHDMASWRVRADSVLSDTTRALR